MKVTALKYKDGPYKHVNELTGGGYAKLSDIVTNFDVHQQITEMKNHVVKVNGTDREGEALHYDSYDAELSDTDRGVSAEDTGSSVPEGTSAIDDVSFAEAEARVVAHLAHEELANDQDKHGEEQVGLDGGSSDEEQTNNGHDGDSDTMEETDDISYVEVILS